MSEQAKAKGRCLCGAVEVVAEKKSNKVGACHCTTCRKWCGGPFMAIDCGTEVSFQGEDNISLFDSSDWAERGFCKKCGTHLFYRLKENQLYYMPADLFDVLSGEESDLVFDSQVFIEQKPSYYCFANVTREMTGEECFAEYGGGEE